MYHPHRPAPRTAAAANSLQTNPTRTNNQRNTNPYDRAPSSPEAMAYHEGEGEIVDSNEQTPEIEQGYQKKLNQVIQNFFGKAALTIVHSRAILPQAFNRNGELKQNRWFNLVLDDTDLLQGSLAEWKTSDATQELPPPLWIEVYLDLQELNNKQTLVINDDNGKRWEVTEMLNQHLDVADRHASRPGKPSQVVLERWRIEVKDRSATPSADLRDPLPNVYKKAVVLFRSLYTYTRFLPAWKYYRRMLKQPPNQPALKLNYRITNDDFKSRKDTLSAPLYPTSDPVTETHTFTPSPSPIGPLCISVTYRTNCDFRIDDAESLLSSHFMGLDDRYFKPTLGSAGNEAGIPGSLPVKATNPMDAPDRSQAYGSLSTFHQVGPAAGSSPISALRAVRDVTSQSPSENESISRRATPIQRATSISKPTLRAVETGTSFQRRASVSFQPFKAGSLSSSPALGGTGSPGSSLGRPSSLNPLMQPRNRTSLTALPQTALRQPSLSNETAIASSASSSPKPAPINRYSSSFGHRRGRYSTGGGSKMEDDNTSSGKASVTSSAHPGSGVLNDPDGGSSGSIQTDDENISDFLKLLEQKKELKSFSRRDSASRDASMRRTTAALTRYQRMRDSNQALSDSMSSSLMLHRSSSSSSRQLSSVPPMVHGTSVSTSSSPGKPISPHTPHTPAIPSRLSANSIIEYDPPPHRSRSRGRTPHIQSEESHPEETETSDTTTTAIDIPTSPRAWPYIRRSSSASQQQRTLDDEPDLFGIRSASLPTEERPDLSLSELLRIQEPLTEGSTATPAGDTTGDQERGSNCPASSLSSRPESRDDNRGPIGLQRHTTDPQIPFRTQYQRETGRPKGHSSTSMRDGAATPPASSRSSRTAGSGVERVSRYSFRSPTTMDDDEPLLFTMSELGAQSRRSIEEGRGPNTSGGGRGGSWR